MRYLTLAEVVYLHDGIVETTRRPLSGPREQAVPLSVSACAAGFGKERT